MLLSTAYFPPVSWFAAVAKDLTLSPDRVIPSKPVLEACENYQKQSYRNRCRIYTSNGVESLSVPVVHEGGTFRLPITEIKVEYTTPWIQRTERAIDSAYLTSAYFEYYRDDIFSILESRPETLWELDLKLIEYLLDKIGVAAEIGFTDSYLPFPAGEDDYREIIHPKKPNTILKDLQLGKPYFQVFTGKYGFVPDLSVIDLLFNEGPDSILYLKRL